MFERHDAQKFAQTPVSRGKELSIRMSIRDRRELHSVTSDALSRSADCSAWRRRAADLDAVPQRVVRQRTECSGVITTRPGNAGVLSGTGGSTCWNFLFTR
jgi:hypothetical protein